MIRVSILAAAILTYTGAANSADVVVPEDDSVPLMTHSSFDWSGVYLGGSLGHSLFDTASLRVRTLPSGNQISNRFFDDSNGFIAGAYLGYNRQFDNFVVGVEGDFEFTTMEDHRPIFRGGVGTYDLNWQSSARVRLGYAFDRTLLYGTAGFAVADIETSATNAAGFSSSDNAIETGYTVGSGLEHAFTDQVLIRGEYRWTDYGSETFATGNRQTEFEADVHFHSLRLGVAWKY